ncbi:hypothetical protein MTO96_033838 [Rhipicephalus appendiculatus]
MVCGKLCTFLWRRLFLQTIRRHYLALLTEIIFVLAMFKFFLRSDRVDLAHVRRLNSAYFDEVQLKRIDPFELNLANVFVVYGPSNDRTDKLIAKMLNASHTNADPDDYYDYVWPSYRDETGKEHSNELSNLVLQDTDESGDSDGDDVNHMSVPTTRSYHHGYGDKPGRGE